MDVREGEEGGCKGREGMPIHTSPTISLPHMHSSSHPSNNPGHYQYFPCGRGLCSGYRRPSEPGQCVGVCHDPLWLPPGLPRAASEPFYLQEEVL